MSRIRRHGRRRVRIALGAAFAVACAVAVAASTPAVREARGATPTAYRTVILGDHPVAFWRLDDAIGATTAADSAGTNPGQYKGGVSLGQPGAIANEPSETSTAFDGSSGYVVVPDAAALDPTQAVTLELWAKRKSTTNRYEVLAAKPGNGQSKFEEYALWVNASNDFQAYFGNGSSFIHLESAAITDTKWHYVVATYDGATAKLYVDGAVVASKAAAGAMAPNNQPLNIGRANGGGSFFTGWLDDVAVYSTALTASQVAAHYAAANNVVPNVTLTAPVSGTYVTTPATTLSGVGGTAVGDAANVTVNLYPGTSANGTPAQAVTASVGAGGQYSSVATLPDGTWTAQATQTNTTSGKTGVSSATTFVVDTVPPTTTISSGPPSTSHASSATFAFSASEPTKGFECSVDGSPFASCSSPASYSGFGNGNHSFQVRATDLAGNVGSPATYSWSITAIATPTISAGPTGTTASANASFTFADTDPNVTGFVCALDSGSFQPCSSPATYTGLADGAHTFQVAATDSAADTSGAATASWSIDTTAPQVTLSSPASGSTHNVFPVFSGTGGTAAGDSSAVSVNVYAGGLLVASAPAPTGTGGAFTLQSIFLQPGTYSAQAVQTDAAGNTGLSAMATFTVGDPVVFATGDLAGCDFDFADAKATGALLQSSPEALVVPLGDVAYPHGQPADYANCYAATGWGQAVSRSRPVVGGHDFDLVAGGAPRGQGFMNYFATQLAGLGPTASDPTKLYYSYDLGSWHVVVLNDGCLENYTPGCDRKAQEQWLQNDLATHQNRCTLALYHEPRFSSGNVHGNTQAIESFWNILYRYGVDLAINGSEHWYERFAPQDAAGALDTQYGIREIVAGTGGYGLYSLGTLQPNSEVYSSSFGALRLTLHSGSYDWQFLPIPGETFTDSGSGSCHDAPPPPPATVPQVAATTQATAPASTPLTINAPAATPGDTELALVTHQGGASSDVVVPAGWTLVPGSDISEGNDVRMDAYTHTAAVGDATTVTFALTSPQASAGAILDITGANATTPFNAVAGQANATASAFLPGPSVTTTTANTLLVYAGAMNIAGTLEPPPFFNELAFGTATDTYKVSLEVSDAPQIAAGPTTPPTGYVIYDSGRSVALTIALAPQ